MDYSKVKKKKKKNQLIATTTATTKTLISATRKKDFYPYLWLSTINVKIYQPQDGNQCSVDYRDILLLQMKQALHKSLLFVQPCLMHKKSQIFTFFRKYFLNKPGNWSQVSFGTSVALASFDTFVRLIRSINDCFHDDLKMKLLKAFPFFGKAGKKRFPFSFNS